MSAAGIVGEYQALQRETDADLLAMQMGDFYEFFGEAARTVEAELDLKVSQRSSGGETYDMAGVPVDDLDPYLTALVERGYRVAVANQVEVDGGHEREISRVVTPGTLVEPTDERARYLATVVRAEGTYGLAFLDVTTGRFQVTEFDTSDALVDTITELHTFDPEEVLPGPTLRGDDEFLERVRESLDTTMTLHEADAFAEGRSRHTLGEHFGEETAESVGLADTPRAIQAAGAALDYVESTGVGVLASISRLQTYAPERHVNLDATTQRTLELTETMTSGGMSLAATIDHTVTSAGGRLLVERLHRPTREQSELQRRLDCIEALSSEALARERLSDQLEDTYDIARLTSRATSGSLEAAGLRRVKETIGALPSIIETIEGAETLADSPLGSLFEDIDLETVTELRHELDAALAEDPGGIGDGAVRPSYDDELATVVERHREALTWIDGLADREQSRLDITRLSVGRNKTDGYYVEVAKSEAEAVPPEYEGIKTLKNAERYILPELEEREREIRRLEARRAEIEHAIIEGLREDIVAAAEELRSVARAFADLDVHVSLASHAVRNDWCRPTIDHGDSLNIESGRHPVVEQTVEFVPNDVHLERDRRFLIVTGPNMSGKSTYMRQVALITLLAQVGSFVPAEAARIGLVDGIYTRVGALDELAEGRSTFMVEMQELSNILHSATDDSLVVLDEVGRGTATVDGISLAWAATEYLHNTVGAKTLFATHYHELTRLADHLEGVANVHMAATERDGDVTFRRTVADGPADRSYGVHVADLAGVPDPVVERAASVLDRLRDDQAVDVRGSPDHEATRQVVFDLESGRLRPEAGADGGALDDRSSDEDGERLDPSEEQVLDRLRDTNLTELSPIELMSMVQSWKDTISEE